ncbi:MAG: MBL fold metallo-hydrolase [Phenylobacterium sp.]|uniref:MBL fold metallo-hydrolase n=1 Tax=Phenylobacterium sp. TaxID=1871053 RepID=UPI00273586AE|nr:MBL fold metallo-hydrolase [Phenylobacterium sp.]MDP3173498.1 MBL fold metallo-hydrolase [Phenylobacterium sp.]
MTNLVWRIGDITVTKIVEFESAMAGGGAKSALPESYPETIQAIPWLAPHFATEEGHLRLSVHALLVETPSMRLVVDTCVGNDKVRTVPNWNMLSTGFLADMEAAGWPADSVDGVICTHLHVDHVGWNTMWRDGRWVPTFPNARYYMGRVEYDHWRNETENGPTRDYSRFAQVMMNTEATFLDSVKPIMDAGLAELVESDAQIAPEVRLTPTPGHSPGHVSVVLESRGERAVITGDMMHHPCQIAHPHWASQFDTDPDESTRTRHAFMEEFADTPTLIIGTHFAGPTAGRLVREDGAFRLKV